jgi:uncharacterized membrane protein YfcA
MLPIETIAFLVTGAALAGLVMGLVGFGTGLAALGFWLFVIDPVLAVPLISICSLATTAFTFRVFSHAISWKRLAPFFIGGAVGLPLGVALLAKLDPGIFKIATGLFLIGYTAFRLLILPQIRVANAGRAGDVIAGFGGGVLGGFASIPAPFSTVWCGLRGWSKDEQRAVYQPFNQITILIAFAGYATQGLVTKELGVLAIYCVPAALAGLGLGMTAYKGLNEAQFQRIVMLLLFASGVMLVALNAL